MGLWAEIKAEAIAEGEAKASESIAVKLIKIGIGTLEQIADVCGLSL